jgi:calcium-dependent protein kinase
MRSVLRFLAQCHTKGLIYRDVKPDNFMFLHSVRHWPMRNCSLSHLG